jgi:hypothetical protein
VDDYLEDERGTGNPGSSLFPTYSDTEVDGYAAEFAAAIPAGVYSVAQIQGYLLTKKRSPAAAIEGVHQWLKSQEEEKRAMVELKQKRKAERARKLKLAREKAEAAAAAGEELAANGVNGEATPIAAVGLVEGKKINGIHASE